MDFSSPPFDRRQDALGDLRVLPDETICVLLDLLSPRDLGRLACVSSAFYILCNEEPLWMSQCLRIGGLIEYKDTWKRTTLIRQNLCSEGEQVPYRRLQFEGLNSLFLYRRWYRCFTNLSAFSLDNGVIERRKELTLEEFHSEFDCKKPALLTELANGWPARTKWTIDQLSVDYGDIPFRISQRSSKKITMKFKDYASYMKVQHDEDPLYIFDDKFGEAAPTLLDDYSVPDLFKEDYFDVLDSDKRPPYRWLIIGPERSGASWHVDPALTSAWNTLLVGRKRWALYPPGRVPAGVTVHVNEEDGDVNIESPTSLQWWLDVYPMLAEDDKPLECTQLPGETIFVPSGWWHCVLNLETTVAVTQNFVNASNFEFVCLDLTPGHRHKGVCRAGLLAVNDDSCMEVDNGECFKKKIVHEPYLTHQAKKLKVSEHGKEAFNYNNIVHTANVIPKVQSKFDNGCFSYDIKFLSSFLEEDRDHYNSIWSSGNCIGQREFRDWLQKLWISKVGMRELIWKGALLALNVEKWYSCMVEICLRHNLPSPMDDEKLPVGTGSNPVFLISDYVIKIYAEDGLENSIYGLGTELEFYRLLHNAKSPLIHHIPDILASGILVKDGGSVQLFPWDGKGVPDVISNHNFVAVGGTDISFGVWGKKMFELSNQEIDSSASIWPYIIIKRCKGELFANLRELISKDDVLHLASFLGGQLRNLHLLPLPQFQSRNHWHVQKNSLARVDGDTGHSVMHSELSVSVPMICEDLNIPSEWELIIEALNQKRKNIKQRLSMWGDPIPNHLIDKVEEYIPVNLALLLDLHKDNNGSYKVGRVPSWIHSDIMDDNILMEPCQPADHLEFPSVDCTSNGKVESNCKVERERRWRPSHIIDFSDLTLGDPLYDFIPIYLDVFRGDTDLLMQMLRSYGLPLASTPVHDALSFQPVENDENLKPLSYRAMCYCILYDENVLGAIFSIWRELRTANSWEEVETAVWGKLNAYQPES